jgi:hypothetical protein
MSRFGQFHEIPDLPERAFCENKYEFTLEGGGKGGSQSSQVEIPEWAQEATRQNLAAAKRAAEVGYMPYYGPQVAAFNPTQLAGMQSNIGAAEAFGLIPQGSLTAAQGMPTPTTYAGGFQGYGSGDLYDQALAELQTRRPEQYAAYQNIFG